MLNLVRYFYYTVQRRMRFACVDTGKRGVGGKRIRTLLCVLCLGPSCLPVCALEKQWRTKRVLEHYLCYFGVLLSTVPRIELLLAQDRAET